MPDWIIIDGVRPWDGRYELDLDEAPFTTREWGWIKRHAGYLPAALDADTFADPEMIAMLAIIAMRRDGTIESGDVDAVWERLQDAPFGSTIRFEAGDRDGDADGPPSASSGSRSPTSGDSSRNGSDRSDASPSRTGSPPSATSPSVPQTSAS